MSDVEQKEVKAISRLLAKTAELAEQASLTGSFEDGVARCIAQYNAALAQLEKLEAIPTGFFLPLPTDAGYGSIGIACAQLASYIGEDGEETGKVNYHGPKYNIMNNKGGGMSKEEREELKALRELLHNQKREG